MTEERLSLLVGVDTIKAELGVSRVKVYEVIKELNAEMKAQNYKELITSNIKLDWILEVADRNGDCEVAMVHVIYDVICDMTCYLRDSVVAKDTKQVL